MAQSIRVAACHVSPIFLSARDTTSKAISLIERAARHKAKLVVFPETYIPAFPIWGALRPPTENHDLFKRMALESVHVDGHGLRVAETSYGKIGNLICGENTNPLARYALMAQGEQIHISSWPAIWPTRMPTPAGIQSSSHTEGHDHDNRQSSTPRKANYDNVAANRTRAAAHCFEAKCFGVLCSGVLGDDAIKAIASESPHLTQVLEQSQRGATQFLDPTGALLRGFTVEEETLRHEPTDFLQTTEDILYADMNVEDCIEGKQYHDVVGGYQRMDVFYFKVNRKRQTPAVFVEGVDVE